MPGGIKGTGYSTQWFTGSCGGTLVFIGDAFTTSPASTTTYFVRYTGTCNTTTHVSVTVTVTPNITIVTDSGNSILTPGTLRNILNCIVDGSTITFTVPTSFITDPLIINKNVTLQGRAAIDFNFAAPGLASGPYGMQMQQVKL
ncbi:MAG: hypothetical protein IPO92_06545 [Saprospiraceae bacterium]|nr:hypothetical protein [Saprospiraceae bacterium]